MKIFNYPDLIIKSGMERGHPAGIRLSIQETKDTDTTTLYKLISSYEGKPIGLTLVIPKKHNEKETGGRALFKSLGAPSDLFLQVLALHYKQPLDPAAKFSDSISFDCINLADFYHDDSDTNKEGKWVAAEYKLFFDSENEETGGAAMFMNINSDNRWIEFAEKDKAYRALLISLLKQH